MSNAIRQILMIADSLTKNAARCRVSRLRKKDPGGLYEYHNESEDPKAPTWAVTKEEVQTAKVPNPFPVGQKEIDADAARAELASDPKADERPLNPDPAVLTQTKPDGSKTEKRDDEETTTFTGKLDTAQILILEGEKWAWWIQRRVAVVNMPMTDLLRAIPNGFAGEIRAYGGTMKVTFCEMPEPVKVRGRVVAKAGQKCWVGRKA